MSDFNLVDKCKSYIDESKVFYVAEEDLVYRKEQDDGWTTITPKQALNVVKSMYCAYSNEMREVSWEHMLIAFQELGRIFERTTKIESNNDSKALNIAIGLEFELIVARHIADYCETNDIKGLIISEVAGVYINTLRSRSSCSDTDAKLKRLLSLTFSEHGYAIKIGSKRLNLKDGRKAGVFIRYGSTARTIDLTGITLVKIQNSCNHKFGGKWL